MFRRRPNIAKLARAGDARRLVAALEFYDPVTDDHGRLFDLGNVVRRDAALALRSVPDTDGVDIGAALVAALADQSGEVRRAAAVALAARREEAAAEPLAEGALTWEEPRYAAARTAAARALLDLSSPESAETVVKLVVKLPADPARASQLVVGMVERAGAEAERRASAAASIALAVGEEAVAERAAAVLSWLGGDSVEALLLALEASSHARASVVRALGRLGDLRAGGALAGCLTDPDPEVRRAAARALGEVADPRSAPALQAATADADPAVREEALTALSTLGPLARGVGGAVPGGVGGIAASDAASRPAGHP